jgi:CRP/FNR family cyclic AMP-dependent transcriptional regulator
MNAGNAAHTLNLVRHFAELPEHVQADILQVAVCRSYPAGQVIFLQGEPADRLYILESGWVKSVRMSPDGREQALLFLHPGEVFGDVAVFTGVPYPGTVLALEPVKLWSISKIEIIRLIKQHNELSVAIIRRLSERILYYVSLVEDLSLRSVEARLARTLLQHAEEQDGKMIVPRRPWTTFDEMSTRLGTVRDVLGRVLRSLEQDGILHVERQGIIILKPEELEVRANR